MAAPKTPTAAPEPEPKSFLKDGPPAPRDDPATTYPYRDWFADQRAVRGQRTSIGPTDPGDPNDLAKYFLPPEPAKPSEAAPAEIPPPPEGGPGLLKQ